MTSSTRAWRTSMAARTAGSFLAASMRERSAARVRVGEAVALAFLAMESAGVTTGPPAPVMSSAILGRARSTAKRWSGSESSRRAWPWSMEVSLRCGVSEARGPPRDSASAVARCQSSAGSVIAGGLGSGVVVVLGALGAGAGCGLGVGGSALGRSALGGWVGGGAGRAVGGVGAAGVRLFPRWRRRAWVLAGAVPCPRGARRRRRCARSWRGGRRGRRGGRGVWRRIVRRVGRTRTGRCGG